MSNDAITEDLSLMRHVRALEGKNSIARGLQIEDTLHELGITTVVQGLRHPKIKNIIVDFSAVSDEKRLLFSAHYDVVKGSPGANDNASSVAVLLRMCQELNHTRVPVRVIFFDREEAWFRTPFLRLGLLGSLYYVLKSDLSNIACVYNLEYCGLGDLLGVWPVKNNEIGLPAIKTVQKAATKLNIDVRLAHLPWLFLSSDHFSFRLKGLHNSVTLSLLPTSQMPVIETMISSLNVPKLLLGRRPVMPDIFSPVHTNIDVSSRLSEKSLGLMLALLLEITRSYHPSRN